MVRGYINNVVIVGNFNVDKSVKGHFKASSLHVKLCLSGNVMLSAIIGKHGMKTSRLL